MKKTIVICFFALMNFLYSKAQWETVSYSNCQFYSISFFDINNGVVGNSWKDLTNNIFYGDILRTSDYGNNWDTVLHSVELQFYQIKIFNNDTIIALAENYLSGQGCYLLRTTNNGVSWNIDTIPDSFVKFDFYDDNSGFAISESVDLYKTSDNGLTWQFIFDFQYNSLDDICFLNDTIGYIPFQNKVLKTIDGGLSWDSMIVTGSNPSYSKLYFLNNDTGYFCLTDGSFYKTIDGGINWTLLSNISHDITSRSLYFANDSVGYIVNAMYPIKTTDGGYTWTMQTCSQYLMIYPYFTDFITDFSFVDSNTGFISGIAGFFRTSNGGDTLTNLYSMDKENSLIIYPNPSESIVNIKCAENISSIRIYNAVNRLVYQNYFNYKDAVIDISDFSEGIYFIEVNTEFNRTLEKLIVQ